MTNAAGLRGVAVKYPSVLRTNEYWVEHHPEMVAKIRERGAGKVWSGPKDPSGPSALFDAAMAPYLDDPFRGTRDRRVLAPGETGLDLEEGAVRDLLEAASLKPSDIGALISVAFQPDNVGVGNGVYLAERLGIDAPAINLETCCSGALVGFQTACALVSSGQYDRVVVSVTCTYSIQCEPSGGLSITSADGGGAMLVERVEPGYGLLGGKTLNSAATCGAMFFENVVDQPGGRPRVRLDASRDGGKVLRETAIAYLRATTLGALKAANRQLSDIDFFVSNTPTAWFSDFCCRALEIDPAKTIDTYPLYANTGPALTTGNLFHALAEGRAKPDDTLLIYSVGSISTVSAAVVRLGDFVTGPMPKPAKVRQ